MSSLRRRCILFITIFFTLFTSCSAPTNPQSPTPIPASLTPISDQNSTADSPEPTRVPLTPTSISTGIAEAAADWPTEGWKSSTPEEQGMDSELLADMLELINERNYNTDSLTIIRNGYLVTDAYFYPFVKDSRHIIHSCTKSIVSALIGIAIEKGYIVSVDQPVLSFFPELTAVNLDPQKESMTLEHLLMMGSGLDCRDSYLYKWQGLVEMLASDDWIQHMLDLAMVAEPGTRFEYCNGGSFLLSAIIHQTTGMSTLAFAQEHLFGQLGITDIVWPTSPQGVNIGWGDMYLKPHDMAKIGY